MACRTCCLKLIVQREHKYTALLRSLLDDFVLQLPDGWFDQPESPKYALHGLHSIKECLLNIVAAHEQLGARFKQVKLSVPVVVYAWAVSPVGMHRRFCTRLGRLARLFIYGMTSTKLWTSCMKDTSAGFL